MQRDKCSRVNVVDMKALMLKKIGPERFKRYFYSLDRFINEKMSKVEFDRMCIRVLGKENLLLHNHIIKAMLKNACSAKLPPQANQAGSANAAMTAGKGSTTMDDGLVHGGFVAQNQTSSAPIWTNGLMSTRKPRPVVRDRKSRDRPSPLGLPNGKLDYASHQSIDTEDSGPRTANDGEQMPCDYQRPIQHLQGIAEQPVAAENEKLKLNNSSDFPGPISGKDRNNLTNGEGLEHAGSLNVSKIPLVAPLGIPFCSASVGGVRKLLPVINSGNFVSSFDSGVLSDSEGLRQRMEQIAQACGLAGGVSMECANSLNNMLDVYLRRLIKSSVQLVGEGSTSIDPQKIRSEMRNKLMNGVWPNNHLHVQSGGGIMEEQRSTQKSISLHDFKVAMDLKPQQLGEDWPLLMEKISMQASQTSD